jgi:hypothetical protein
VDGIGRGKGPISIYVNEILVQEKEAMSRRAGVLNLMLHSTFNHELAMLMQQQQAALHAKKQNRFDYCLGQLFFSS